MIGIILTLNNYEGYNQALILSLVVLPVASFVCFLFVLTSELLNGLSLGFELSVDSRGDLINYHRGLQETKGEPVRSYRRNPSGLHRSVRISPCARPIQSDTRLVPIPRPCLPHLSRVILPKPRLRQSGTDVPVLGRRCFKCPWEENLTMYMSYIYSQAP